MRIVVTVNATAVVSRNPGDGFGCADRMPWPSRASVSDQGTETHTIIVRDFDSTATQEKFTYSWTLRHVTYKRKLSHDSYQALALHIPKPHSDFSFFQVLIRILAYCSCSGLIVLFSYLTILPSNDFSE
jgi:hypothetical protein